MNRIVLYIAGALFLLGILFRICFALFFPKKFAEGAREMLFLDEREKKLKDFENHENHEDHG